MKTLLKTLSASVIGVILTVLVWEAVGRPVALGSNGPADASGVGYMNIAAPISQVTGVALIAMFLCGTAAGALAALTLAGRSFRAELRDFVDAMELEKIRLKALAWESAKFNPQLVKDAVWQIRQRCRKLPRQARGEVNFRCDALYIEFEVLFPNYGRVENNLKEVRQICSRHPDDDAASEIIGIIDDVFDELKSASKQSE